jgi:hypothetical protein
MAVDSELHAEWNRKVRGETEIQRLDRNFGELLQELRVAQTGVQILFAFLLTLAFTEKFSKISPFQQDVYIAALMLTLAATGLLIAPVAYHRLTFRQRMRPQLVGLASLLALGGLTFLMLALCASIFFISDVVLNRSAAVVLTGIAGVWLLMLWYVLPWVHRILHRDEPDPSEDSPGSEAR